MAIVIKLSYFLVGFYAPLSVLSCSKQLWVGATLEGDYRGAVAQMDRARVS